MLKYLRIAVTALSLTACVLFIALWARSFWALDFISRIDNRQVMTTIGSDAGTIYFAHFDAGMIYAGTGNSATPRSWKFASRQAQGNEHLFLWRSEPCRLNIVIPHWCFALIAVLPGLGIWLPCRFSLRTLLIATTLVVLGLGLLAAAR